jgi:hypothetical protein
MASGHVNRVKRPNTWLHRPMLQNVKKVLANPEPSTQDPKPPLAKERSVSAPPDFIISNKISALTIANGSSLSEIASMFLIFCCVPLPGMLTWGKI